MLKRSNTWVEDLYAFVRSRKDTPYAWGSNDCCSFVCDAILAMTGTDVYSEFRGKYTDEAGAGAILQTVVGSTDKAAAIDYITTKFAMPEITVPFAQRGDVVLLGVDGGFALGIVHLDGSNAAAVAAEGLHRVPLTLATRAWRV
jgi:cell wall-associated NlpC family hydrolase